MLAGEARGIASVRTDFLGVQRGPGSTPCLLKETQNQTDAWTSWVDSTVDFLDPGIQLETTGFHLGRIHPAAPNLSNRITPMTLAFAPERIEQWPLARLQPYAKNAKLQGADQVSEDRRQHPAWPSSAGLCMEERRAGRDTHDRSTRSACYAVLRSAWRELAWLSERSLPRWPPGAIARRLAFALSIA